MLQMCVLYRTVKYGKVQKRTDSQYPNLEGKEELAGHWQGWGELK